MYMQVSTCRIFRSEIEKTISKLAETNEIIVGLSKLPICRTTIGAMEDYKSIQRHQNGYLLGLLKANYDTLPEIAKKQTKFDGVPIDLLIKLKVDENIIHNPEASLTEAMYNRCSIFVEEWENLFADGTHNFVLGFAEGYAFGFHNILEHEELEILLKPNPILDIWYNVYYFYENTNYSIPCKTDIYEFLSRRTRNSVEWLDVDIDLEF